MTPPRPVGVAAAGARYVHDGRWGGFHLASVVFRRAKQLQNGARPRVDVVGHRPPRLALLEVLADRVSWTAEAEPAKDQAQIP